MAQHHVFTFQHHSTLTMKVFISLSNKYSSILRASFMLLAELIKRRICALWLHKYLTEFLRKTLYILHCIVFFVVVDLFMLKCLCSVLLELNFHTVTAKYSTKLKHSFATWAYIFSSLISTRHCNCHMTYTNTPDFVLCLAVVSFSEIFSGFLANFVVFLY